MRKVVFNRRPWIRGRAQAWWVACYLLLVIAPAPAAPPSLKKIEYTVKVADVDGQILHVTTDINNINQPALDLSLPAWTPGWYVIENYAKNILRFQITDADGKRLQPQMVRKQTWRVDTKGITRIKVDFDYQAKFLALNQARIAPDYAFFTGTQLFLQAEGHRGIPCTVRFEVPAGWQILSALKETTNPMVFTAPDYDTLVDQPTEMGKFDVTRFMVEGKPHYIVANPAGAFSKEKATKLTEHLTKVATAESQIFGGLPYEKYVYFYFAAQAETNATGALEHQNSLVAFVRACARAEPDEMVGQAAHEFFHLWNVKRIRPVEMWPYDYARENETPLLWVSEGFTSYYGALTSYRAGFMDDKSFLSRVAGAATAVESNEARKYISPADASRSTWIGYDTPVAFGISYYTQGQNLGALLDLSIRHDAQGAAGLDDVMRLLFRDFYQRGRGFTTEDLIGVIKTVTGKSYQDFFRRYVTGVEVPPYDTILGHAGYKLERNTRKSFDPGFGLNRGAEGWKISRVPPDSYAQAAGVQVGDIVLSIEGLNLDRQGEALFRALNGKLDQNIKLKISRGGDERELEMKLGSREELNYRIVEEDAATPAQLKIRGSWLRR